MFSLSNKIEKAIETHEVSKQKNPSDYDQRGLWNGMNTYILLDLIRAALPVSPRR